MIKIISQHKLIIGLILLGISLRLIFAFSFNHVFDFFNILVITKSEVDTNSALESFFVIKNVTQHETQLFGKFYYQIIGLWLKFLESVHILDIKYIFDYKAYDPHSGYMSGFGQWGPFHYQLVAIKLIQFLFEGIFLYFFLSLIRLLKPNADKLLITGTLFWAVNPFMIYPSYVPFQSDLAMTSFLLGGLYFGLKSFESKSEKMHLRDIILMTVFFAVGAIIKQVPLLFLLPLLIVLSKNLKTFIIGIASFAISYVLISQPWSGDADLYKSFFLTSPESTALFKFGLNSASVFMMLYIAFIVGVTIHRDSLQKDPWNILKLSAILFALIYISEDLNFLYAQFNLWIMPIIFLLALKDRAYALFLLAPVVGFYRWVTIDNGASIGSLWVTFGRPLADMPSFDYVLQQFLSPFIIHTGINSLFIVLYILLITYILNKSIEIPFIKYVTLHRAIYALILIYAAFFIFDLAYRGNLLRLTNINYHSTQEEQLTMSPIKITAINPEKKAITGIDIQIARNNIQKNDYVQLVIKDMSGKKLDTKRVSDFDIPVSYGDYFIPFNKAISLEKFTIYISKVYGQNTVVVKTAENKSIPELVNQGYMDYDAYYKSNKLDLSFPEKMYVTNLRGRYSGENIATNLMHHIKQKPSFYIGYFALLGISLTTSFTLIFKNRRELFI